MKKSNFITILIFALFIAGSIFVMNKDYNKEAVHKVVKENSVAKVKKPVSKPQKKKEEKKQDKVEEDKKQVSSFSMQNTLFIGDSRTVGLMEL